MKRIGPDERAIRGNWVMVSGRVQADDKCRRIEELVAGHLREIGRDWRGWNRLFVDPDDGRFWELTYPQGELHGGGPPCLSLLDAAEARGRYRELTESEV